MKNSRKCSLSKLLKITISPVHHLIFFLGGYQSGQMGQTVNLLAQPSEVRILLPPQSGDEQVIFCGSSSFGRAEAFQASGGGFEPRLPLLIHFRLCSSGVEHFLGKEGVSSSILLKGSQIYW
jgi:hypothetical protein